MTNDELVQVLQNKDCDLEVQIKIYNPNHLGGSATVDIDKVNQGIDWDRGKIIITPSKTLTTVKDDGFIEEILQQLVGIQTDKSKSEIKKFISSKILAEYENNKKIG